MFDSRKDSEKYHLLRREDGSMDNDDLPSGEDHGQDKFPDDDGLVIRPRAKTPLKLYYCIILLATLNLIVVSLCFGVLVKWNRLAAMGRGTSPQQLAGQDVTPYAKLGREPSAPWPYDSGYGPEITNHSLLDERWEALSIDDGIVAIDHAWAAQMNLGPSQNFPWDESKGLYVITAYHTVHCLMTLHRLVYELHHGLPRTRDTGHALHCLAHMRTDAMCEADDFLLPTDRTQYMRSGPRGQPRVCRSWDQLADWARQNHACYQHISDDEDRFAVERDEIERYFACPEDSPYYARMQQYKTEKGY